MKKKFLLAPVVLASIAATTWATSTQASAPVAAPTVTVKRVGTASVTQTTSADGETVVSVSGPKTLSADITDIDTKTTESEATLPALVNKTTGATTMSETEQANQPTIYEDMIAGGSTPEEACAFVADFDERGCETSASLRAKKASQSGPAAKAASGGKKPYDSWCINTRSTKGDGVKTSHACVIRYRDFMLNKDWYVANTMKMTARSKDPGALFDRLNDIRVQMRYGDKNVAVDWSPSTTRTIGSCKSTSTSVSSTKTNVSYSSSQEVCPDKLEPFASPAFRYFGSRWSTSSPRSGYVGTTATSLIHSPPAASVSSAKLYSYLHWN